MNTGCGTAEWQTRTGCSDRPSASRYRSRKFTADIAALAMAGTDFLCGPQRPWGLNGIETAQACLRLVFYTRRRKIKLMVSRTGIYGATLGYELWVDPLQANALWDALMLTGTQPRHPSYWLNARSNIARIEAGFPEPKVDFVSAEGSNSRVGTDRSPAGTGFWGGWWDFRQRATSQQVVRRICSSKSAAACVDSWSGSDVAR